MKKFFTFIAAAFITMTASAQLLTFSETAAVGSINGKTFEQDGLKLTVTDGSEKAALDENSAYFCTSIGNNPIQLSYRLKSGGKTSIEKMDNYLTLTIPEDGTLLIYARSGSNSATNRTIVVTQDGEELFNEVAQETDTLYTEPYVDDNGQNKIRNVYKVKEVKLKAGEAVITYPVGAINFYAFELIPAPKPIALDELPGRYSVHQTGTTWLTTNWSEMPLDVTYISNLTVSGGKVTLSNIDNWGETYAIEGTYDVETSVITFQPTTLSWYTAAAADSDQFPITMTVSKDNDAVTLTSAPWSMYYGSFSYENSTIVATRISGLPECEWTNEATVVWMDSVTNAPFYQGECVISKYANADYEWQIECLGSDDLNPATVQFKVVDGEVVLTNGTYSGMNGTGGYWYYFFGVDDAWLEAGDGCEFTGDTEAGSAKICYWYYTYDSETKEYTKQSHGYIKVSWPMEEPEEEESVTIENITTLIDNYLDGAEGVTIEQITNLIDEYLAQ